MTISMESFGLTDVGRVRKSNEDQFLIADLAKSMKLQHTSLPHSDHVRLFGHFHGSLLLVADGMGGHESGEKASGLAIRTVIEYVLNMMPWFYRFQENQSGLEAELKTVLEECQRKVSAASEESAGRKRMGTTLTMAYILWPQLYVVHAGDSRCYLIRDGQIHQVTHDHTVAQQLLDRGLLTAEQAERSRLSHVLWNCIGGGSQTINPDVYQAQLEEGDMLLLCSDGLSKYVSDQAILNVLKKDESVEAAVRQLVNAALDAGGKDNITVVIGRATGEARTPTLTRECVTL